MILRDAHVDDTDQIARIWHAGWHEAHASLVPGALTQLRTPEEFQARTPGHLANAFVGEIDHLVAGFCMIKGNELDQLYVSPEARGTGLAQRLVAEAEKRIGASGADHCWLKCAIGNTRARKFYEGCGWHLARTEHDEVETANGPFPLEIWRFEKALTR